ncbi:TPA_asm: P [Tagetes erecta virus 1]|uniref:P n=1 Tax=Tagetes erecta virus 1 TaxID=2793742 RepID=A0A8D9PH17_9RHAB|nr:P [Tagetes erecta virus 1] [Tagetes erecta virus 1]DAF42347.1 TPA_asm: P [Tagetes erecta virus 1]
MSNEVKVFPPAGPRFVPVFSLASLFDEENFSEDEMSFPDQIRNKNSSSFEFTQSNTPVPSTPKSPSVVDQSASSSSPILAPQTGGDSTILSDPKSSFSPELNFTPESSRVPLDVALADLKKLQERILLEQSSEENVNVEVTRFDEDEAPEITPVDGGVDDSTVHQEETFGFSELEKSASIEEIQMTVSNFVELAGRNGMMIPPSMKNSFFNELISRKQALLPDQLNLILWGITMERNHSNTSVLTETTKSLSQELSRVRHASNALEEVRVKMDDGLKMLMKDIRSESTKILHQIHESTRSEYVKLLADVKTSREEKPELKEITKKSMFASPPLEKPDLKTKVKHSMFSDPEKKKDSNQELSKSGSMLEDIRRLEAEIQRSLKNKTVPTSAVTIGKPLNMIKLKHKDGVKITKSQYDMADTSELADPTNLQAVIDFLREKWCQGITLATDNHIAQAMKNCFIKKQKMLILHDKLAPDLEAEFKKMFVETLSKMVKRESGISVGPNK